MAAAKLSIKVSDNMVYYSHTHYVSSFRFVDDKPRCIDSIEMNGAENSFKCMEFCQEKG